MATRITSILMLAVACHGANDGKQPATDNASPKPAPVTPAPPAPAPATAPASTATTLSFDADKPDTAPAGFTFGRTGKGAQGKWVVKAASDAPSGGKVLEQLDADATDDRFPVALANEPTLADVRVSVRCKAVSGKVDQGCGLIVRAADADNYYVARTNALENNVRLYHVVKGVRKQFAGWDGAVKSGAWHELRIDAKADHFEVYFDGQKVIDAKDTTFANAGKVGLWTKADSVIYFDDLTVAPL